MSRSSLLNQPYPYRTTLGAALLALALAGCAQQQPAGYYDVPQDNTAADARNKAQGRSGARAPSQIQLGFGQDQPLKAVAAEPAPSGPAIKARPLAEARTFLGTVPCLSGESNCSATRITLTMAPSGEWRSRTVFLDNPDAQHNITQQGCWDVIGTQPLRIMLMQKNETSVANLTFINDNVLRINMINDIRPTLEHRLTRQADVDAIDEITSKAPLQCD
ncbi:MAG: hypothetical protein WBF88_10540 [Pusillimonas sp.]